MKDKRIWIVIICILVTGIGVTHYTEYYVKSQAAAMDMAPAAGGPPGGAPSLASIADEGREGMEEAQAPGSRGRSRSAAPDGGAAGMAGLGSPDSGPGGIAAADGALSGADPGDGGASSGPQGGTAPGVSVPEGGVAFSVEAPAGSPVSGPSAPEGRPASGALDIGAASQPFSLEDRAGTEAGAAGAGPEAAAIQAYSGEDGLVEQVPISPLTGAKEAEAKQTLIVDYRQRLMDLDTQIQKMREQEMDSNVYSIKTSAETELKMWEGEMNSIYNALLELLSQEDAAGLAAEQQEWLKNRETKAAGNTGKNSGSVERIGYAASLAGLTRDRAYDLAGRYEDASGLSVLQEEGTGDGPSMR